MAVSPIETAAPARVPDRGVARRQAFLQAAREVFLEQGYEAASVNDVVRLAGGQIEPEDKISPPDFAAVGDMK